MAGAFAKLCRENENVTFLPEWTAGELEPLLNQYLEKAIRLADESLDLGLAHKRINDREVYFVLNDSEEEVRTGITFNTKEKLEEWDPDSGEIHTVSNGDEMVLKPYHGKVYRTQ